MINNQCWCQAWRSPSTSNNLICKKVSCKVCRWTFHNNNMKPINSLWTRNLQRLTVTTSPKMHFTNKHPITELHIPSRAPIISFHGNSSWGSWVSWHFITHERQTEPGLTEPKPFNSNNLTGESMRALNWKLAGPVAGSLSGPDSTEDSGRPFSASRTTEQLSRLRNFRFELFDLMSRSPDLHSTCSPAAHLQEDWTVF